MSGSMRTLCWRVGGGITPTPSLSSQGWCRSHYADAPRSRNLNQTPLSSNRLLSPPPGGPSSAPLISHPTSIFFPFCCS
jgi:hypothetical protein